MARRMAAPKKKHPHRRERRRHIRDKKRRSARASRRRRRRHPFSGCDPRGIRGRRRVRNGGHHRGVQSGDTGHVLLPSTSSNTTATQAIKAFATLMRPWQNTSFGRGFRVFRVRGKAHRYNRLRLCEQQPVRNSPQPTHRARLTPIWTKPIRRAASIMRPAPSERTHTDACFWGLGNNPAGIPFHQLFRKRGGLGFHRLDDCREKHQEKKRER